MGQLTDFLMRDYEQESVQREVMISPFPFPFILRSITQEENKELEKSCEKKKFNPKTKQTEVETDRNLYVSRLLVTCCVEPNFKDADLQARFGVMGAEALAEKLLTPGQYSNLMLAVQELNGFDDDINDLVEEAKN